MSTTPALRGAAAAAPSKPEEGGASQGVHSSRNRVVVSGFGPFRGISDNPSQRLVEALQQEQEQGGQGQGPSPVVCCRVIEVSAVGAEEAVEALHCEAAADGGNDDGGGRVVFLHMGVDGGATEFKLECRAMNEADFRCPDERQHQPRQTPILAQHEEGLEHAYYSHLDLASLARGLRAEGWPVNLSHNAGRFVCNWTYYHSLHRCTQAPNGERACVFLHVPPFATVPFERQLAFVRALIGRLAAMEPHAQHGEALKALAPPPGSARSSDDETEGAAAAGREGGSVFVNDATFLPPPAPAPAPASSPAPASADTYPIAAAVSSLLAAQQQAQQQQQQQQQQRFKMVLVVRTDLGMSPGKIAAQCVHAALGVYQAVAEGGGVMGAELISSWQAQGEPVIALKCDDLPTLRALESTAFSLGLPTHVVRDAGRTEVEAGSVTVLAVGPATAELIDMVTGELHLL